MEAPAALIQDGGLNPARPRDRALGQSDDGRLSKTAQTQEDAVSQFERSGNQLGGSSRCGTLRSYAEDLVDFYSYKDNISSVKAAHTSN